MSDALPPDVGPDLEEGLVTPLSADEPAPRRRFSAKTSSLAGAAALITVVTLASRIVGFGRWLAQAQFLGTGGVDAPFNSANILPNVLFEVAAGGALAGAIIPLVAGPLSRIADGTEDEATARAQASQSASALLGWAMLILIPLGAITTIAATPISRALNLADPVMTQTAAMFLRVFALQIPIYGVAVVLGGVLQAHRRFFWPAFAPLVSSIVVIGVFAAFSALARGNQSNVAALSSTALNVLAWGTTLGVAFLALPLLIPIRDTNLRLRPTLKFPPGEGARASRLALAGIGALIAQQLSVLVIMRTANAIAGPGAWTIYLYIQQIYLLPYAVLAFPIATSAFPQFTALAAGNRRAELADLVSVTTRSLLLAMGVGAAALIAAAAQIQAVFGVIATGEGVDGLATGLMFMAPGLFGYALILHLSKVLYAVDAGRAAVTATALGWVVVSVLAVVLVRASAASSWAVTLGNLGLANAIGMTVAGIGLLLAVRRKIGPGALHGLLPTALLIGAGVWLGPQLTSILSRFTAPGATPTTGLPGLLSALGLGVLNAAIAALTVLALSLFNPALRRQVRAAAQRIRRRGARNRIG